MGKLNELNIDQEDTIYGLDVENSRGKLVVCKSNPLLSLHRTQMTLLELKLFDVYLGRINPQNDNVTKVVFEKKELEELFDVEKINARILREALKHLIECTVVIREDNRDVIFSLLSTAVLEYEDRNHLKPGKVTLECSEQAKKYIYNIEAIGYIKMNLSRMLSFSSRNAYAIYQYINAHTTFNHTWVVSLSDLKQYMGLGNKYNMFSDFDKRVLKPAQEEIHANTDMLYEYEPIMNKGKVDKIKFTVIHRDRLTESIPISKKIQKKQQELLQRKQLVANEIWDDELSIPFDK